MEIKEIINSSSANDTINALKEKSVVVPDWGNLSKEYDVENHEIMDTKKEIMTSITIRISQEEKAAL